MAGDCGNEGTGRKEIKKYSVLMSVYGKEKPDFLKESLASITTQTVMPDQIVLICDGPLTAELDCVVEQFRSQYPELFLVVRLETCGGLGPALQVGIGKCRNELIARMDSDDISVKNRCEMQLEVFNRQHVDIVGGIIEEFDTDIHHILGKRVPPETSDEIRRSAGKRNPFNHMTVMYRKSVVLKAGGYQDFPYFEDYYLWARMLKNKARGYNIRETLVFVRTGESMYARRGGFAYAKLAVKFRFYLRKAGISSLKDFIISAGGQFFVCILPNGIRKKFYETILRKA